jgi:hypothetical protein
MPYPLTSQANSPNLAHNSRETMASTVPARTWEGVRRQRPWRSREADDLEEEVAGGRL